MDKSDMELSGDWDIVSSTATEENDEDEKIGSSSNEAGTINLAGGSRVEDQENAVANDSSSDIDVIDENLEEIDVSAERCFIPSSLPISSSGGISFAAENICEPSEELAPSSSETFATLTPQSEESETTQTEDASGEESQGRCAFMSFRVGGRSVYDWIGLIWEYFQSLTGFQVGCLFGLTFCIYFCITINQTNIIALQEKGNVVGQMEKLVDELRHDNKHLQEKMLSEMKNDKLVSSFEHQIRELKVENSKLNHMLHDVVKVLEKQKDTQEKLLVKKEHEYQAPFKKEINKLREHINMLKIDNEELQKQLVRIRYSSYSQGSKHKIEKDEQEHAAHQKKDSHKNSESFENGKGFIDEKENNKKDYVHEELPLDILQLKKWNELLDQFAREYGILSDDGSTAGKKEPWNWKEELKNKFKKPTDYVSDFAFLFNSNIYEKLYSDAYKYLKDVHENMQSMFTPPEDPGQNSDKKFNMWNAFDKLGKKWTNLKEKISSYDFGQDCPARKEKTVKESAGDPEPSMGNDQEKEHMKSDGPNKKPEKEADSTHEKWFFKRAQLRENLRNDDEDKGETKNWFLRRTSLFSGTAKEDENQKKTNLPPTV